VAVSPGCPRWSTPIVPWARLVLEQPSVSYGKDPPISSGAFMAWRKRYAQDGRSRRHPHVRCRVTGQVLSS